MGATKKGKVIIFSAPSGCGKSTIINALRQRNQFPFSFSISATTREPRGEECHGVEYYFLTEQQFREHIERNDFVEYCEVYPGRFYGTLKSEIIDRNHRGENIVLDVDVEGGINIKKIFGAEACSIFIMPPSVDELKRRLEGRGTDSPEKIADRIKRAQYELSLSGKFDHIVVNDVVEKAVEDCENIVLEFLQR